MPLLGAIRYQIKGALPRYRNALVPDRDAGCRNADAGGTGLDADAQLFQIPYG